MPATGSKSHLVMDETSTAAAHFDWRMTESFNMSIQLSLDGLSFCILDPVTNVYQVLTDVRLAEPDPFYAKQEEYILNSRALNRKYRKVHICVDSPTYTMMPISLYDESRIGSVMALTGIKVGADDKLLRNDIELANSTTAFGIPNFLYFFLRTQFPNAEIFHATTPVISSLLLKRQGYASGARVSVIMSSANRMTIVATEDNELKLCNTFYCKEVNDYVYMLLFAMEQLRFDVANTHISVSGNVSETGHKMRLLRRFIPMIELSQPPSSFDYAFAMPENPHKFNTLLLIPLCV